MIDVILPVLNEADSIPAVLMAMPPGFAPLIVDNGSDDGSAEVALSLGARVVTERDRGFGAACCGGPDGGAQRARLLHGLRRVPGPGAAAGRRRPGGRQAARSLPRRAPRGAGGAWPAHARLANRLLALELRRRAGVRLRDIGPMRCAPRERLLALGLEDRGFGWPLEMVLRAAAAGWRSARFRSAIGAARGGESKVTGSVRGSWRAVRDMRAVLQGSA